MKLNKKIIQILIISAILFINPINAYADSNNDISIDSIFGKEEGLWYPGRIESKDFAIENNREKNILIDRLSIELKLVKDLKNNIFLDIESKQFKELSKNTIVRVNYEDTMLFEERLDELISKKDIVLSKGININPNDKEVLNMTIDILEEMNDDAQDLENIFNIGASYKVDDTIVEKPITPDKPINPEPDIPSKPETNLDGDLNLSNKLPQTGGMINSASLVVLGTIALGTGLVLNKKSSKEKGDKKYE